MSSCKRDKTYMDNAADSLPRVHSYYGLFTFAHLIAKQTNGAYWGYPFRDMESECFKLSSQVKWSLIEQWSQHNMFIMQAVYQNNTAKKG